MTVSTTERRTAPNRYEAPATAALLASCLESTINGQPLPEGVRPSAAITCPPVRPFSDWVQ